MNWQAEYVVALIYERSAGPSSVNFSAINSIHTVTVSLYFACDAVMIQTDANRSAFDQAPSSCRHLVGTTQRPLNGPDV